MPDRSPPDAPPPVIVARARPLIQGEACNRAHRLHEEQRALRVNAKTIRAISGAGSFLAGVASLMGVSGLLWTAVFFAGAYLSAFCLTPGKR